jgi:hypothetical protein
LFYRAFVPITYIAEVSHSVDIEWILTHANCVSSLFNFSDVSLLVGSSTILLDSGFEFLSFFHVIISGTVDALLFSFLLSLLILNFKFDLDFSCFIFSLGKWIEFTSPLPV